MLQLKLEQDFEARALRRWRLLFPTAERLRLRVTGGANAAMIGAVGGWGMVVVLGAALMTGARHEAPQVTPEPPAAVASVAAPVAPAPAPVMAQAKPAPAAPATAPAPPPTKVTQRIDMSPTAAIAETPKPHKKPHKKKTKDLDNPN